MGGAVLSRSTANSQTRRRRGGPFAARQRPHHPGRLISHRGQRLVDRGEGRPGPCSRGRLSYSTTDTSLGTPGPLLPGGWEEVRSLQVVAAGEENAGAAGQVQQFGAGPVSTLELKSRSGSIRSLVCRRWFAMHRCGRPRGFVHRASPAGR